jgi:hypothetical protein
MINSNSIEGSGNRPVDVTEARYALSTGRI